MNSFYAGEKNGVFGIVAASILGIVSLLCMYGTIPLLIQWLTDGMSLGTAAVQGIRVLMLVLPVIMAVISFWIYQRCYKLKGKRMQEITRKLNEMHVYSWKREIY